MWQERHVMTELTLMEMVVKTIVQEWSQDGNAMTGIGLTQWYALRSAETES